MAEQGSFSGFLKEVRFAAILLGSLFMAETVLAQPFVIPSGSMEPTLLIGDKVLATKSAYGLSRYSPMMGTVPGVKGRLFDRAPVRGDVIVFEHPTRNEVWVKRLIGLPGDRIAVEHGRLIINGEMLPVRRDGEGTTDVIGSHRVTFTRYTETLPGGKEHVIQKFGDFSRDQPYDNMPEITVPAGYYFMMGDNRDNSADSRVPIAEGGVGLLPADNLIGRVDRLAYSLNPETDLTSPSTWGHAFRAGRFLTPVE